MLKNVKVLDEDELSNEHVGIGSKVKALDLEYNEEVIYQIVGSTESDPMAGRISDESPVGQALLGHKVGDIVEVEAPVGILKFEILDITK